jgi:hypothetical protein
LYALHPAVFGNHDNSTKLRLRCSLDDALYAVASVVLCRAASAAAALARLGDAAAVAWALPTICCILDRLLLDENTSKSDPKDGTEGRESLCAEMRRPPRSN